MFEISKTRSAIGRNRARLEDRAVTELVGICRGVLADGAICESEAAFVRDWIARNEQFTHQYPFDVLYRRLASALCDGVLDPDEEADLLDAMAGLVGGEVAAGRGPTSRSSSLPLCSPPPEVAHEGSMFVVTGTFDFGTRAQVVSAIQERGGSVNRNVVQGLNYLVIGNVASRDWVHSSFGRKVEAAVGNRASGFPVRIVSEDRWREFL